MKTMTSIKTLISVAALAAITSNVSAVPIGTPAGTDVNNTASISYSVGGTNQTPIESSETGNTTPGAGNGSATNFVVDKKIDLLVTGNTTDKVVQPEQTGAATDTELSYTLTNEGNSTENFSLAVTDDGTVGTAGDEFNSSNCTITAPANPTAISIDSGDNVNIVVECDIPVSGTNVANGKKSLVDVLATVTGVTATTGADTAGCISGTVAGNDCVVDVVFADGVGTSKDGDAVTGFRNAKHSATSNYIINAAGLTVQKTQAVSAMDASGTSVTTGNLYHIPGATVVYTVTVSNASGSATATGIVLSDNVPTSMTLVGTPVVSINGGADINATSGTSNTVASASFDLNAGDTAIMTITAKVN